MEKLSYAYYSENYQNLSEKYSLEYFLDMDNPADMRYTIDYNELSIGMLDENEDQVAAWLPDGEYIYVNTSLSEVIEAVKSEYNILFER